MYTHLHSEVQGCVSILALQVGIRSVGEQHHGRLKAALLGHNMEGALSSFTEVVDCTAMFQKHTTHLANREEDLFEHLLLISLQMLRQTL